MTLQKRIKNMISKNTSLTNVIQVMLFHRILPCQLWPLHMWEFNPEGPRTLQYFSGTMLRGMWKLFFGPQKQWPDTTEDIGLDCNHSDTSVSTRLLNTA